MPKHHYMEDQIDLSAHEEENNTVQFNAVIEPPREEPKVKIEQCHTPPPPPPTPPCCLPEQQEQSDLLSALPTILVAMGVFYAIGLASGALFFSAPID